MAEDAAKSKPSLATKDALGVLPLYDSLSLLWRVIPWKRTGVRLN